MSERNRGIFNKYDVRRADGTDGPGGKHDNCFHFVLDGTHDPYALSTLEHYATLCRRTHPALASDLRQFVSRARVQRMPSALGEPREPHAHLFVNDVCVCGERDD